MAAQNPQSNNYDSQNNQIDIVAMYNSVIQLIDSKRSTLNVSNLINLIIQKKIQISDIKSFRELVKYGKTESSPQESRCHAFYRMIGFPVVSNNLKDIYNPGLDIIRIENKQELIKQKISIASNQIDGFQKLSLQREKTALAYLDVFSTNETLNASTLTLSSLNTRDFNATIKNINDLSSDSMKLKNHSYVANLNSVVGNNKISLLQYIDGSGNYPDESKLFKNRYHILAPFIVDPIIDATTCPDDNLISIPFTTKQQKKIKEQTYVSAPLLDKIIYDRFNVDQSNVISTTDMENFIKNDPTISNEAIIQNIIANQYGSYEKQQFLKYLNIIRAMLYKLTSAQRNIRCAVQNRYYFLPIPSTTGPESSCSVRDIIITEAIGKNSNFVTTNDKQLIKQQFIASEKQTNNLVSNNSNEPDVGGYNNELINIFDPDTNSAYGNIAEDELKKLEDKRNNDMSIACDDLRIIEIIMGEFSGLGLCDIVAVMATLYIMPKDKLIGFLDPISFDRMETQIKTKLSRPSITDTMSSFIENIKNIYNLMDKIHKDYIQKNSIDI